MTESQIFTLVIAVLNAGLAAASVADVDVRQADQPRVVGAPDGMALLLYKVKQHRYGSVRRQDDWIVPYPPDYPDGAMVHSETQAIEMTIQCGALSPAPPPPAALPPYRAGDLVGYAAAILQSDAALATMQAASVGIERILDIRQPTFTDDTNQFQASPSFDFTLTFNRVDITINPVIAATVLDIVPI